MTAPAFNVPTRPLIMVADAPALRAATSNLFVDGMMARIVAEGTPTWLVWDAASLVDDDGALVFKPTDIAGGSPGRWSVEGQFTPTSEVVRPSIFAVRPDDGDVAAALDGVFDNVSDRALIRFEVGDYGVDNSGSTTVAAGSDGQSLPQATINVATAAAFRTSGKALVETDAGQQVVTYAGKTGTTLTGCAGGSGAMSTGGTVRQTIEVGTGEQTLDFPRGSALDITGVASFTPHLVAAADQQIFKGTGFPVFTSPVVGGTPLYWFGANGDRVADNKPVLVRAHSAAQNVIYASGEFRVTSGVFGTPNLSTHHFERGASLVFESTADATIAAGSNGLSLPQATINVDDATDFDADGAIRVRTSTGTQVVTYAGKTGTSFTGCSGGTGVMSTGGRVTPCAVLHGNVDALPDQMILQTSGTASFALPDVDAVHPGWHNAQFDGVTVDSAAWQASHDSLPAAGGTIRARAGTSVANGLVFDREVRLEFDHGGITSDGSEADIIRTNANLFVEGLAQHATKLFTSPYAKTTTVAVASNGASLPQATINVASTAGFPTVGIMRVATSGGVQEVRWTGLTGTSFTGCTGGTGVMSTGGAVQLPAYAVRLSGVWTTPTEGEPTCEIHDLTAAGGGLFDARATTGFNEGSLKIQDCVVDQSTWTGISLPPSLYYSHVIRVHFVQCYRSLLIPDNTETIVDSCTIKQASNGVEAVRLEGPHHVVLRRCEFLGFSPNVSPDVLITAPVDLVAGFSYFDKNKFGPEREYWLHKDRCRIRVENAADEDSGLIRVDFLENEFLGPNFLTLASIGRSGGTATATISGLISGVGHGLQVGDKIIIAQVTDSSFCGVQTVTAIGAPSGTTQTVSWANAGGDLGQSNRGGVTNTMSQRAVDLPSPINFSNFKANLFFGYGTAVDDRFRQAADMRDDCGRNVWTETNEVHGPAGYPAKTFSSGVGRFFSCVHLSPTSAGRSKAERGSYQFRELPEVRNRLADSNDFSTWGNAGTSITTGQPDPWGGTAATKLTRSGTNPIATTAGTRIWGITEGRSKAISLTGVGAILYVTCWAKASSAENCLWIGVIDGSGYLHATHMLELSSSWERYEVAVPLNASIGGGALSIDICPGLQDAQPAECYLAEFTVCDYPSMPSLPVTGGAAVDTGVGLYLQKRTARIDTLTASALVATDANKKLVTAGTGTAAAVNTLNVNALSASQAVVTDGSKNLASLPYTTAAAASSLLELDSASRAAMKGLISSGSAPSVTLNSPANAFGTSGVTYTLETGSNDMAGVIIINTGPSPAAAYAFLDLNFSTALPGNLPTINFTLEGHNANFAGGSTTLAGAIEITARTNSVVRFYLKNAGVTWTASTSDAYRIHYQVMLK
jgi:hypothetical protein